MEPGLGAAVERRTTQLLEDARRSYELAWRDFQYSYERAITRLEELFASYEEFLRQQGRPSATFESGRDLVFTLATPEVAPTRELVFDVSPFSPGEVARFFESSGRDRLGARWGSPFG